MGFRSIAFESPFTESVIAFLNNDSLEGSMRSFLYPFWNTPCVKASLYPFHNNERGAAVPSIIGFDMQEDCRFTRFSAFLLNRKLVSQNREGLLLCDSILSQYIGRKPRKSVVTKQEQSMLSVQYQNVRAELEGQANIPVQQKKLLIQAIQNRLWLCTYLTLSKAAEKMHFRDSHGGKYQMDEYGAAS